MRKIFTFLLGALLVMFLGCHSVETSSTVVRIDLKSNGHKQLLTDYSSPYTLAYRNKDDTYTLYIFSAPVQYQKNGQYFLIDTSIVKSKRADYSFENKEGDIKTYFPESLDRPFLIESETNQFSFQVEKNASSYQKGKQIPAYEYVWRSGRSPSSMRARRVTSRFIRQGQEFKWKLYLKRIP